MKEEFKGTLKFYDEKITVLFPSNFDKFKVKLGEMLGLADDFFNNIRISYKDEDGDKVEIKVEEDYKLFIEEINKSKKLMELLVEVKEESNLLIKKCSSSIINYISKNSSGNINKLSEQIKEKHNSLELSDEIEPNNIVKEEPNSMSKEEKEKENKNENIKQEEKSNNNNNNMDKKNDINVNNNIDNKNNTNDKNKINNIDNIEKEKNNQKKVDLNNNNNINSNQNNNDNQNKVNNNINNNNINNINNQNPQNSQNKNIQQPQLQNQKQSQIKNDSFLYAFSFPYSCKFCYKAPIYHALYFCNFCKYIICPDCELKEGPSHKHPFYKVQNSDQFETLNLGGEGASELDKLMEGFNNFFGIFGGNMNNNNNNQNKNNVQKKNKPQRISLVQLARTNYDLRNVTDQQIEEALIKSKGNVDEAVVSLFGQ